MPICLLIRHGHSTANGSGILAGWTDGIALSETGVAQASDLAEALAPIPLARLVSSPLQRCQETAAAIATGRDPQPELVTDPALGEAHYGAWTGRAIKDLAGEPLWSTVQQQPSAARFPDSDAYAAESLAEMAQRSVAAVRRHDEAVGAAGQRVWVAVSHGDVIKAVLADAAGAHLDHFQRFHVDPGSVSVVTYTAQRPFVLASNASGSDLARIIGSSIQTTDGHAAIGGGAGSGS